MRRHDHGQHHTARRERTRSAKSFAAGRNKDIKEAILRLGTDSTALF
jgi:hypothetical protein